MLQVLPHQQGKSKSLWFNRILWSVPTSGRWGIALPPTAKGLSPPSVGSLGRVYTHLPEAGDSAPSPSPRWPS